ncbi:MAG: hypothetical protein J6X25_07625 [Bacteroidales bacterium]|nr:hypothetical protein [Bacteroidales bacterium]
MRSRIFGLFSIIVPVLAAFSACTFREEDPEGKAKKTEAVYHVHFKTGELSTKTAFGEAESDGVTYPTLWTDNDSKIAVSLNLNSFKSATVSPAADFKTATFDADFLQSEVQAPYVFYALSPFSACVGATSSHGGFHLDIPAEQTPLVSSCDESAQLLVSSAEAASVDSFSSIDLPFEHLTAYGRLTLTNLGLSSTDQISSIELTASVPFAGRWYYNFGDGTMSESSSSRTITIKPDNLTVSENGQVYTIPDIWFACAPCDLGGGSFRVDVNTGSGIYRRTVDIPAGRLSFNAGQISKFSVNMSSAEHIEITDRWVLVTNASSLEAGDEIIIATSATAGQAYALSTTQNSNNRGRAAVTIAKDGDNQMIIQNPSSTVEVIRLVSGYYTGYFYLQETADTQGRYIGTTSSTSQNYLRSNAPNTAGNNNNRNYYNWIFNISNSVAYITAYATLSQSRYKHLRHNNGSAVFSAYLSNSRTSWSGNTNSQNVYVYRKETGVDLGSDPILQHEQYGAYLSGGNHILSHGGQLSREQNSDGTVNFAIITSSEYTVAEFTNIPSSPAKGDSFTLGYNYTQGRNTTGQNYNVTVVKVDGPKVWLTAGSGNGFIVKK